MANPKSKIREMQMKTIMRKHSRAQTKGSFYIPPLITSAEIQKVECTMCLPVLGGKPLLRAGGRDIGSLLEGSLARTKVIDAHAL